MAGREGALGDRLLTCAIIGYFAGNMLVSDFRVDLAHRMISQRPVPDA